MAITRKHVLQKDWFTEELVPNVDASLPGIYQWRVNGYSIYVGQYSRSNRPRRHYSQNLSNLLNGLPYRKGKPDKFRQVHHDLKRAYIAGSTITLRLIENHLAKDERNKRERELIAQHEPDRARWLASLSPDAVDTEAIAGGRTSRPW